ncbi:DUF6056 family protein [Dysgonomonas sp. BGC7]|uniref:DUF3329 domain-containing protein n=1 Tax=Dysgonomonas sp. BGC7 TaxID=1658008 RepID=UPI000681D14D|nr:DUF6056 family protein [Dysgonomonas sp. BGC7]MBD8389723.1 hypothetical protein [Dysgonomonas sp. BGC7]
MIKQQVDIKDGRNGYMDRVYKCFEDLSYSITNNPNGLKVLWAIMVVASFSSILFLNILTPLISDDFAYLFIYNENVRVESIGDIIQSQINHYYLWGGRSVVHFIAQVLLLLPPCIADILNSLIYIGYVFLIYWHVKGNGKNSVSLFMFINLTVWFFQPVLGDTVFWITGSANYLWGTFFILLFLLPFRLYRDRKINVASNIIISVGMFILGIIAGWTNENTAGAMILIAFLYMFYFCRKKWLMPIWGYCGIVGAIIGFAVMILAPGNFERAGEGGLSFFLLAYRVFNATLTFFYYCGPLIMVCVVVFILSYHYNKNREGEVKDTLVRTLIYYIAAVAAVYAMLLSPTFPRRALFGVVSFLIIGVGILVYTIDYSNRFLRQIRNSVLIIGTIGFFFTFYLASKEINTYRQILLERNILIENTIESGGNYCEFERYDGGIYIHGEDPFSEKLMSRYYGITIKLK